MSIDGELGEFFAEEFDESNWTHTTYQTMGVQDTERLASAQDTIRNTTANTYLIDIYTDATNLRNILGDVDGMAAEIASSIRRNVLVIAATMKRKPSRLVIDAVRALSVDKALVVLKKTVAELQEVIDGIEAALENNNNVQGEHNGGSSSSGPEEEDRSLSSERVDLPSRSVPHM